MATVGQVPPGSFHTEKSGRCFTRQHHGFWDEAPRQPAQPAQLRVFDRRTHPVPHAHPQKIHQQCQPARRVGTCAWRRGGTGYSDPAAQRADVVLGFERHEFARTDFEAAPGHCHHGAFAVGVVQAAFVVAGLVQAGVDEVQRSAFAFGAVMQQAGVVAFHHTGHVGTVAFVVAQIAFAVTHSQIRTGQARTIKAVQR